MPKDYGRNMRMDSRMVDEIQRSPQMMQEQGGSAWLADWGGPGAYIYWSKQPLNERMTYFAVLEGYSTSQDIADVTGLAKADVTRALTKLSKQGLVETGVIEG